MTRARTVISIALPILAACSENSPTDPAISALARMSPAAGVAASPERRFGGRCETDITILPPEVGDPPNLLRLHIEYVCQLKHLGRTTAVAEQIVIFTGPTTAVASNTTTYTAANGDQLFAIWTGTSTNIGPAITFSGPETYTGGTGRFSDASGSAFISGTASFVTNTGQFTVVGTLSY
jgi:hypothetical protein